MKLHRFYVPTEHNKYGAVHLTHDVWIHNPELAWQWRKVLRFQVGREVILFDGEGIERLYKITELKDDEAHVQSITDFESIHPKYDVYLFWSILKKDKNDWVLQKCTELGVNHFVPVLAERCDKTGFNMTRAQKIIVEASEQCGRANIPHVREPIELNALLHEYAKTLRLLVAEQESNTTFVPDRPLGKALGVLIGPEGGWSTAERELFAAKQIEHLNISSFTLRAETAAIVASSKLL